MGDETSARGATAHFCALHPRARGGGDIPSSSWRGTTQHKQVVGNDPESDPPLHPTLSAVPTTPQAMTAFQCADPAFTSCAPSQGGPCPPRARFVRLSRQHDMSHA